MLDQLVRDFTNNIAEAEEAVAQTVGNLRLLEDDHREAQSAQAEWGDKARAAARKADEMRGAGNTSEADRFDELAKIAIRRQISFENQVTTFQTQIEQQTQLTDQLKDGLNKLRVKREELVQKRDELISRSKMATAQRQVQEAVREVSEDNLIRMRESAGDYVKRGIQYKKELKRIMDAGEPVTVLDTRSPEAWKSS